MRRSAFILGAVLLVAACAPARQPATHPSVADVGGPDAMLPLDQIKPIPSLPNPVNVPADSEPSIAVLGSYASGVDALMAGRPDDAIDALEHAIRWYPYSYQMYLDLGRAQLDRLHAPSSESFAAFEHAAALRPDNLQIHLLLGRQYLAVNDLQRSMLQFRLALQTDEFKNDAPGSAAVELFLARVLQQVGYDRASLDEYLKFADRLQNPTLQLEEDPDVGFLVQQPQLVWTQIGQLYERHGQYADALEAYEEVAQQTPDDFEIQQRIVWMMLQLNQTDAALQQAAAVITRFDASSESLAMLRAICQRVGYDRVLASLKEMTAKQPENRAVVFAMADILTSQGRRGDARDVLEAAQQRWPGDADIGRKLFGFYMTTGDASSAGRLLVMMLAANPESEQEFEPMFEALTQPNSPDSLRLSGFEKLNVPSSAEPARFYLESRVAELGQRFASSRSDLEKAAKLSPPFAPAYRSWIELIWNSSERTKEQKIAESNQLADAADNAGALSLAEETRGLSLLEQGKNSEAIARFQQAIRLGRFSPDLQRTYAAAMFRDGRYLQGEQTLWELVARQPKYDDAWQNLYEYFDGRGRDSESQTVLTRWTAANPASARAQLTLASYNARHGQADAAGDALDHVLADHADDLLVLNAVGEMDSVLGRGPQYLTQLEALRKAQPANLTVVQALARFYLQQQRTPEALALLNETRSKLPPDPRRLYLLSDLFRESGDLPTWEAMLKQVLQIDPKDASASNDLGYAWADDGLNLPDAERLIRTALAAEPDNEAFLDSMGWVLYKRGKFAQARDYFKQAVESTPQPDPGIVDHFGDLLYRLNLQDAAARQWSRALNDLQSRSGDDDQDDAKLIRQLQRKLDAVRSKQPAPVAPIAGETSATQRTTLHAATTDSQLRGSGGE